MEFCVLTVLRMEAQTARAFAFGVFAYLKGRKKMTKGRKNCGSSPKPQVWFGFKISHTHFKLLAAV